MSRTSTFTRALYGTLLVLVALATACSKNTTLQAPPPPPPVAVAPPARPTVTLQSSSTFIQSGDSVTLTWSSTNATMLSLAPDIGAVTAEGMTRVAPKASITYTITATGPGGAADSSVHITVSPQAPPAPVAQEQSLQELFDKSVHDAYFDYDQADIRAERGTPSRRRRSSCVPIRTSRSLSKDIAMNVVPRSTI